MVTTGATDSPDPHEDTTMATTKTTRGFDVRCPFCGADESITLNVRDVHDLYCTYCDEPITLDKIRRLMDNWERLAAWLDTAPERA